jgi:hypothetical protein
MLVVLSPGLLARALCVAVILAAPARVSAYVRTRTSKGAPLYWDRTILGVTAYVGDPPAPLTSEAIEAAVRGAAAAWSRRAVPCTSIELRVATDPGAEAPAQADGESRLVFRHNEWCMQPPPPPPAAPCYDSSILAVTSVFSHPTSGKIVDADIEVNAVGFSWSDRARPGSADAPEAHDLQNALTHELGHLIGFDHTCWLGQDGKVLIDDHREDAPSCFAASPEQAESTLFPSVMPSDLDRRTLTADDKRGLCEVYPTFEAEVAGDPAPLACALGPAPRGRPGSGGAWLAGLVGALVMGRRTWRRARATRPSTGRSPAWRPANRRGAH